MMNEFEVPQYISNKLPEIENDLKELQLSGDIHESIQVLTDFTKKMVLTNDLKKAGKCMELAEKIFLKGNKQVKQAIQHVFVLSFNCYRHASNSRKWSTLLYHMPSSLYGLYLKQLKEQTILQ
jgi:hypothetical protein